MTNFSVAKPLAKGFSNKGILGVDSSNDALTTSSSTWKEFFVPTDEDFMSAVVRIGNGRPTDTELSTVYEAFLWCDVSPDVDSSAVILPFSYLGKNAGESKRAGESLGWFKSSSDAQSVVLWARQ